MSSPHDGLPPMVSSRASGVNLPRDASAKSLTRRSWRLGNLSVSVSNQTKSNFGERCRDLTLVFFVTVGDALPARISARLFAMSPRYKELSFERSSLFN